MAEEKEKPLTREDVLKLIKENGGTAKGLDFSGKTFETSIDLSKLNLEGINLKNAIFVGANLRNTNLNSSQLQGVNFVISNLQEANLEYANLEGAQLLGTNLCGAVLTLVKFTSVTLGDINWGNYILGEEKTGGFSYYSAVETYRRLKIWYTEHGMYNVAGKFFFREMTANRKSMKWWPNPFPRAWSKFLSILCGYGEKWHRVIISAVIVVFGLALIYLVIGTLTPNTFINSLYYSAVSFTALGYGSWAPEPTGWVKGLGAFEAFLGVFMMALFLITFTRKMTR